MPFIAAGIILGTEIKLPNSMQQNLKNTCRNLNGMKICFREEDVVHPVKKSSITVILREAQKLAKTNVMLPSEED